MPIARNPRARRLGAGVHLVSIVSITYARNFDGSLLENRNSENALEVKFKNQEGYDINGRFWLSVQSEWILEAFYKAVNVNVDQKIDVEEMKGRRLWICVAEKRITKNQNTATYFEVLPRFMKVIDPTVKPSIAGDPLREGNPSGIFLIEENYDVKSLPVFDEDNDEIPWKDDCDIKL